MRAWIFLLRLAGLGILFLGVLGRGYAYAINQFRSDIAWFLYAADLMTALSIAVICFGAASALAHIAKLERKSDQQRQALRYLLRVVHEDNEEKESLAPDAPGGYSPVESPGYEMAEVERWVTRLRRTDVVKAGNPAYGSGALYEPGKEVRQTPLPSHEIQAPPPVEQDLSRSSIRTSTAPMPSGIPDRSVTEHQALAMTARDAYLRRLQTEQKKKRR
ncbi:MAG: hypothetical protein L6Q98_04125 [Anaerolineae bacterium]|nr:hypothetical protein [Anaerolineae bacterium]NUQ07196.1 hypothetical protein [Anaerolineae bacterium]